MAFMQLRALGGKTSYLNNPRKMPKKVFVCRHNVRNKPLRSYLHL